MNSKILSVVIPTYNMEKYLSICLDSVTDKRIGSNLEVIVVNDGSHDRSLEIMRKYECERPDIVKVIDKKNGHYGSCVNEGLSVAVGKYFRILDADDWFDTSALVSLLTRLENCDSDLVLTHKVEERYVGENKIDEMIYPIHSFKYNQEYQAREFSLQEHGDLDYVFMMHGMTYKTSLLKKINLKLIEGINYTDTLYSCLPYSSVKSFIMFDLHLYHYRVGREGQSVGVEVYKNNLPQIVRVINRMFEHLEAEDLTSNAIQNQIYFIKNAVNFCLQSLKIQRHIPSQNRSEIERMGVYLKKYRVKHRLLKRWYFSIWLVMGKVEVLNASLIIRSLFKK